MVCHNYTTYLSNIDRIYDYICEHYGLRFKTQNFSNEIVITVTNAMFKNMKPVF